ncbi:hypothetical protein ACWDTT_15930 [Streptosporangium sandarakinum]
MTSLPEPIYDVNVRGRGTGFNLSLEGAQAYAAVQGGTIMVSHDNGKTWQPYNPTDS